MNDLLVSLVLLAQDSPGPRGDNPDGGGGVLIIAAIVAAALIGGFLLHALLQRYGRARPEAMTRRPARKGEVGRVSEFQDR